MLNANDRKTFEQRLAVLKDTVEDLQKLLCEAMPEKKKAKAVKHPDVEFKISQYKKRYQHAR